MRRRTNENVSRANKGEIGLSNIKGKIIFAKNCKWIIGIITLICMGVLVYLFYEYNLIEKIKNLKSETIAVIGTLLGAFVGGVFTLIGSIYVNRKQIKAQTHIKKKNLIYKPLYDELIQINEILKGNPYPRRIAFKIDKYDNIHTPQYSVWGRIKADTRYLETPKYLICEYELLMSKIDNYIKTYEKIGDEITDIINGILQEVIGTKSTIGNIGDCLAEDALSDSQEDVFRVYLLDFSGNVTISQENKLEVNNRFYEICNKNEKIKAIRNAKQQWKIQQEKVVDILTNLIKYVNIKYED